MNIDLSRFKVVYGDKVLNVISLQEVDMGENTKLDDIHQKPKIIAILVINEDGNIEFIRDEAWRFQFLPIVSQK